MEPVIPDPPPETPSGDEPVETTETPSEPEPESEGVETDEDDEPKEPKRNPAWDNLAKKFAHIEDPKLREDAIAAAYWEKTNFASRTRRENETLKKQLARIDSELKAKPKEPETPPPTPQELQELDTRLKSLYDEDQALIKEAHAQLSELNSVDAEIAKAEARIEDAKEANDEAKQLRFESKLVSFQTKKDGIVRAYKTVQRDRLGLAREYEKVGKDRLWLEQSLADRSTRKAQEDKEHQDFKDEFPEQVDRLIESAAGQMKIPESYLEELTADVNDGILVDLWKLGEVDLDEVDLPELVRNRVEKFAKMRNIVARRKFAELSKEKLRVASPTRPAAGGGALPAKPVTPASMNQGDQTPKMARARAYLMSKGY